VRKKKLCILCRLDEATLPDRNVQGRQSKKVCVSCHRKRLLGDLKRIETEAKRVDYLVEQWRQEQDEPYG
jgi:hypothetical protein